MRKLKYTFFSLLFFISPFVFSQNGNNLRVQFFTYSADTISIDTLTIVPGSEMLTFNNGGLADSSFYHLDPVKARLVFKKEFPDTLRLVYRVLPYNFSGTFKNKDIKSLEPDESGSVNPFVFNITNEKGEDDIFKLEGLNKSGSISRGVNFGNNQDLSVNSNLNLQLSGKVHDNVSILAAITDNNIPIQPDGNTQQLQDFDQVYIQLFDNRSKMIAGDFQLTRPNSHFMNFYKRAQGGSFSTSFITARKDTLRNGNLKATASAAVSKGKFARNIIPGIEGNQGPYRLKGSENETFIIALSGTENVYMDGVLLSRGQENDYIIDYNAAEITFTATRLVTKDKRIIVEFQYSDKNYARSLVHVGNEYEGNKWKLNFNIYSEQDARNQTLQQDLNTEKKQLMADVGDSLHLAVFPNINDSVVFSIDQVLYALVTDTVVGSVTYDSVYVYSNNPATAKYSLGFSLVGQGKGNYNQVKSTANGKVFEWVAPVNGVPQGAYEPVTLLVTPKQRQMITFGGDYLLGKNSRTGFEMAVSNNDINTFSSKDNQDDTDIAFKVFFENNANLSREKKEPWMLKSYMNYEQVNKNFSIIERFRTVEFERDWNLLNKKITETQHISTGGITFAKKQFAAINYEINSFNSASEYNALKNSLNASLTKNNYEALLESSHLLSEGFNNNTQFIRQKASLAKKFKLFTIGFWEDQEQNKIRSSDGDSLLASAYEYLEWEVYIRNAEADTNKFGISYKQRTDYSPLNNNLRRSTFGESVGFDFGLYKNPKSVLKGNITYRTLTIKDSILSNLKPENTILSRLEHNLRLLKGAFTANTFYEIGSGLEVKKEFSFLKVPAGQGVYAYIGDLNDNDVQDLNEFGISPLIDKAEFIKVFTPTNQFVKVFTNQFNEVINIDPNVIWGNKKGIRKMVARFSNQTAYRIDRKTNEEDLLMSFDPLREVADSALITLNSSLRNTIFFNRTHPKFGLDYSFQDNRNKVLLTNGVESRTNIFQAARARWNISHLFMLNLGYTEGIKTSFTEFFTNRNFNISYSEAEPKITFQPGTTFRVALSYKYTEKKNDPLNGGEQALTKNIGLEMKYSIVSKGNLLLNVNYILNTFDAVDNTALAFEMLEGLQPGENITWALSYQRNLSSNMQLSLNYTGRTSETAPAVHTGGVQVRAFF